MVPSLLANGVIEYCEVLEYGSGDSFGELALLRNAHRAASIYCKTDCHFAVLDREDFARIVGRAKETSLMEKVEFLSKFPFFARLSRGALQQVSYYFKEQTYSLYQPVFSAGDPASRLYFIKSGDFQILENLVYAKSCPSLRRFKASTSRVGTALLTTGQFFGDDDALSGRTKCTYSVLCNSAVGTLFVVSKDDFLRRVSSDDTLRYLKLVQSQRTEIRRKCFATLKQIGEMNRVNGDTSDRDLGRVKSPVSPNSFQTPMSPLGQDLRQYSVAYITGTAEQTSIRTDMTSVDPIYERPSLSSHEFLSPPTSPRPRLSWDKILRKQHSEKERKSLHKSSPIKAVNIHLKHLRKHKKSAALRLGYSQNSLPRDLLPVRMVMPLDPAKIRFSERGIFDG